MFSCAPHYKRWGVFISIHIYYTHDPPYRVGLKVKRLRGVAAREREAGQVRRVALQGDIQILPPKSRGVTRDKNWPGRNKSVKKSSPPENRKDAASAPRNRGGVS